jgi:hypothetical protein
MFFLDVLSTSFMDDKIALCKNLTINDSDTNPWISSSSSSSSSSNSVSSLAMSSRASSSSTLSTSTGSDIAPASDKKAGGAIGWNFLFCLFALIFIQNRLFRHQ